MRMDDEVICKLWWPKELTLSAPEKGMLLFGWFFGSVFDSRSIDVVVAVGIPDDAVFRSDVEEELCSINKMISVPLCKYSVISLLGHYAAALDETTSGVRHKNIDVGNTVDHKFENSLSSKRSLIDDHISGVCDYPKLDNNFQLHRKLPLRNCSGSWIQLIPEYEELSLKRARWIPKLLYMHEIGQRISACQLHVIIYETPIPGNHHLSLRTWNFCKRAQNVYRVPNWLNELQKKQPTFDLEMILLSLNRSNAVKQSIEGCLSTGSCHKQILVRSRFTSIFWHILASAVASISTTMYIIFRICYRLLVYSPPSFLISMFKKIFKHTSVHMHVRCSQLQCWPTFLLGYGHSFHPNVEYAHESALRRHALWSSIVIDILLGNIIGLYMLANIQSVHIFISNVATDTTNSLLKSGCVWLMGVPAGFKLNTELAELIGMIALNAIQIWSTLGFFMSSAFGYVIYMLALSGILLGLTIPAALCIDLLKVGSMHISSLQNIISFLYSQQIQALVSLWRIFRGQKWNPLRQRLDSFDYTLEEHVVGSLLFTPIFLLLPTTTVFYIFFTIVNLIVSFISIIIEIMISILYTIPYYEIFIWMIRKGRFPSGIWFETVTKNKNSSSNLGFSSMCSSPSNLHSLDRSQSYSSKPSKSIYVLHSNLATIGQILTPLLNVFEGHSLASGKAYVYRILTGQRITGTFRTYFLPTMPRIDLSVTEYWRLCHASVIGCRS